MPANTGQLRVLIEHADEYDLWGTVPAPSPAEERDALDRA
jgi:hypothetical protein